ncbi:hypothetical protein FQZ97_709040 [compost metagenome]
MLSRAHPCPGLLALKLSQSLAVFGNRRLGLVDLLRQALLLAGQVGCVDAGSLGRLLLIGQLDLESVQAAVEPGGFAFGLLQ